MVTSACRVLDRRLFVGERDVEQLTKCEIERSNGSG